MLSPAEVQAAGQHRLRELLQRVRRRQFASRVWTNNAWVAALCIALGVLGLPVVFLLLQNIVNLGVIGWTDGRHGRADLFFGLILPHGMLELTAVFVAAGVGLRIFWAWVEPGPGAGSSPSRRKVARRCRSLWASSRSCSSAASSRRS